MPQQMTFNAYAQMLTTSIMPHRSMHIYKCHSDRKPSISKSLVLRSTKDLVKVALRVALDAALVQAGVDAKSNVGRDVLTEALKVSTVNGLHAAKSSRDDIRAEVEEGLGNLLDARVDVVEAGDEDGILAVGVELLVDRALGKDGHLVRLHGVGDGAEAVLDDKISDEAALHDHIELGGAVVDVGRVHAAGAEEAEGHGGAVADEGREGLRRGGGGEATLAAGLGALGGAGVIEVEDEVAGLVEEADALLLGGCGHELCDEVFVAGAGVDGDDGGKDIVDGAGVGLGGDGGGGRGVVRVGGRRGQSGGREEDGRENGGGVHLDYFMYFFVVRMTDRVSKLTKETRKREIGKMGNRKANLLAC